MNAFRAEIALHLKPGASCGHYRLWITDGLVSAWGTQDNGYCSAGLGNSSKVGHYYRRGFTPFGVLPATIMQLPALRGQPAHRLVAALATAINEILAGRVRSRGLPFDRVALCGALVYLQQYHRHPTLHPDMSLRDNALRWVERAGRLLSHLRARASSPMVRREIEGAFGELIASLKRHYDEPEITALISQLRMQAVVAERAARARLPASTRTAAAPAAALRQRMTL